jgi:FkbM family methyltransferase
MKPKQILLYVGLNQGGGFLSIYKNFEYAIGFEPIPHLCKLVADSIHVSQHNTVKIVNCALSDFTGTSKFYIASNGGASSSLGDWDNSGHVKTVGEIEVNVQNLRDILKNSNIEYIDTLITDAQGCDLNILRTIKDYIDDCRIENIQIECYNEEINRGLDNDYRKIFDILRPNYELVNLSCDGKEFKYDQINLYNEFDSYWRLKKQTSITFPTNENRLTTTN